MASPPPTVISSKLTGRFKFKSGGIFKRPILMVEINATVRRFYPCYDTVERLEWREASIEQALAIQFMNEANKDN